MDTALKHADLDDTLMYSYPTRFNSASVDDKLYWMVSPNDSIYKSQLKYYKTRELFQEVVYLTAVLLHVGGLNPEEVSDHTDEYFETLRDRALEHWSSFFKKDTFTTLIYYKTDASKSNIIRYLTLCGMTFNGNQKGWLNNVYESENIIKIFFPNLYNTNVRTLSTSLKGLTILENDARSRHARSEYANVLRYREYDNPYAYVECNPFIILGNIQKELWSPKLPPISSGGVQPSNIRKMDINPSKPRGAWGDEDLGQIRWPRLQFVQPSKRDDGVSNKMFPSGDIIPKREKKSSNPEGQTRDAMHEEVHGPPNDTTTPNNNITQLQPPGNPRNAWDAQDETQPPPKVDKPKPDTPVVPAQSEEEPFERWGYKRDPPPPKALPPPRVLPRRNSFSGIS